MLRTQFSKALLRSHRVKACARVATAITSRRFVSDTTSATFRSIYEKGSSTPSPYDGTDSFPRRHLGPTPNNVDEMLKDLNESDLDSFIAKVVPDNVLIRRSLKVQPLKGFTESEMLADLARIAEKNDLVKPLIGKGFYGTIIPPVILRNLLENPGWYTSYTPYQPEVSQGRLESLLNFQTVISDLTGLPVANASLLDESSAAAEAMILSFTSLKSKKPKYFVDSNIHEQTLAVLKSRAHTLNIEVVVADFTTDEGFAALQENKDQLCGAMVQYPATDGSIKTFKAYSRIGELVHSVKGLYAVASDLMALTLLHAPSKFGADIVFGSSQRFGVPLGYGGPHAAFFSVVESLQRKIPGRIVGVSKDRLGNNALRLALQTREQHIKRERATSNICTAQALLANIAANYVVYHGIEGLRNISKRIHGFTTLLANSINESSNYRVLNEKWFDTLSVDVGSADEFIAKALSKNFNVFKVNSSTIQLSLDETVTKDELTTLISLFTGLSEVQLPETLPSFYEEWTRQDDILTNEVFRTHRSETSMLRYLYSLQKKDISLADSMISLGSCTMKLNATVEMMPISWPKFASIHPFAPKDQVKGYTELIVELEKDLADITGFHSTTLQPNSGAQGEYTGLSVIAKYFESKGEAHRNIVLIPVSAHGTNPASAAMAGLKVVPIKCLKDGSLDLQDLESKASKHAKNLAAMMVTYPSTYGLFEPGIIDAINIIHNHGGQVYLDGANMNAQVGLTSPGDLGADVCHLNLHKTFAIPHGGGGPGVGPICVKEHLTPFLPSHPIISTTNQTEQSINPVVAAPFGSASILPISYAYIKMMGGSNLQYSSIIAILNANYMVAKLKNHYEILFTGGDDKYCGHEFIIDLRPFKKFGIEAIDVAKRLQDYGFHAPTMSFPIPGTLMVEPTESEYKEELDRFIDSMISIREEIRKVENGETDGAILHNSPHNLKDIISTSDAEWSQRGYTREEAAYPLPFLKEQKTWPTVSRVDDTYGDMNLLCTCPSVEEVAASQ